MGKIIIIVMRRIQMILFLNKREIELVIFLCKYVVDCSPVQEDVITAKHILKTMLLNKYDIGDYEEKIRSG